MARNRKSQSAAIRFGPALKAVVLCLIIGGSAMGYVWQKDQLQLLSDRIVKGERRLDTLRQENEKLRRQLLMLRSPSNLEYQIERLNLGLVQPAPGQILRLREPVADRPVLEEPEGRGEYAANQSQSGWSP